MRAATTGGEDPTIPENYPLARRALIRKAREIDPALADGTPKGP